MLSGDPCSSAWQHSQDGGVVNIALEHREWHESSNSGGALVMLQAWLQWLADGMKAGLTFFLERHLARSRASTSDMAWGYKRWSALPRLFFVAGCSIFLREPWACWQRSSSRMRVLACGEFRTGAALLSTCLGWHKFHALTEETVSSDVVNATALVQAHGPWRKMLKATTACWISVQSGLTVPSMANTTCEVLCSVGVGALKTACLNEIDHGERMTGDKQPDLG